VEEAGKAGKRREPRSKLKVLTRYMALHAPFEHAPHEHFYIYVSTRLPR
jgi:hypothetical protein